MATLAKFSKIKCCARERGTVKLFFCALRIMRGGFFCVVFLRSFFELIFQKRYSYKDPEEEKNRGLLYRDEV